MVKKGNFVSPTPDAPETVKDPSLDHNNEISNIGHSLGTRCVLEFVLTRFAHVSKRHCPKLSVCGFYISAVTHQGGISNI